MSGASDSVKSCGVIDMFGTSMAAPVVAGNALLIREYFSSVWPQVCRSNYVILLSINNIIILYLHPSY